MECVWGVVSSVSISCVVSFEVCEDVEEVKGSWVEVWEGEGA